MYKHYLKLKVFAAYIGNIVKIMYLTSDASLGIVKN